MIKKIFVILLIVSFITFIPSCKTSQAMVEETTPETTTVETKVLETIAGVTTEASGIKEEPEETVEEEIIKEINFNPVLDSVLSTNNSVTRSISVKDNIAYVVCEDGLKIIDIADKKSPKIISNTVIKRPNDVFIESDYAYIARDRGFEIIDISKKEDPVVIGSCDIEGVGPHVCVESEYAFVVSSQINENYNGSFICIDISNKEKPYVIDSIITDSSGGTILKKDNFAYFYGGLIDGGGGLLVANVSNKEKISPLDVIKTDESLGWVSGLATEGNYIYYSYVSHKSPKIGGLLIIDITDKENPSIVGSYSNIDLPKDLKVKDGYAFISYRDGMKIIDVNDPKNPKEVSSFDVPPSSSTEYSIDVDDNYVYLAHFSKIYIINLNAKETVKSDTTLAEGNKAPEIDSIELSPLELTYDEFVDNYSKLKIIANVTATDPEGDPISYTYQWYKNGETIPDCSTNELPAGLMERQGHTIRGYEYKVVVALEDDKGNKAYGEKSLVIGGPSFDSELRGISFANMSRIYPNKADILEDMSLLVKRLDINFISIGWSYWQSDVYSNEVYEKISNDPFEGSTITEENLINQIKHAHELGLEVLLYPSVCIDDPEYFGHWPDIPGSKEWFQSYKKIILRIADISEEYGVEVLCIGQELDGTIGKEQEWRNLIAEVRKHYSGKITYATIFDDVGLLNWWDALDYISTTGDLLTGTNNSDPTVEELKNYYRKFKNTYKQVCEKFNKPFILVESGCFSMDGGTYGVNYLHDKSSTVDFQEQSDYFEAVFELFYGEPWLYGLNVGGWVAAGSEVIRNDDSSIKNKYAEKVIKSWFSQ